MVCKVLTARLKPHLPPALFCENKGRELKGKRSISAKRWHVFQDSTQASRDQDPSFHLTLLLLLLLAASSGTAGPDSTTIMVVN